MASTALFCLPRKFKMGIALPEDNCIDVYTHDIGLLAVVEAGQLVGYNVLVGGGLGTTPGVKETFPRLGKTMAFVPWSDVLRVATAIIELLPLLAYFKFDRRPGEALGDFCHRKGLKDLLRFKANRETAAKTERHRL